MTEQERLLRELDVFMVERIDGWTPQPVGGGSVLWRKPNGNWVGLPDIPCKSRDWAAVGPLAEKHHLALIPLEDGRWAAVPMEMGAYEVGAYEVGAERRFVEYRIATADTAPTPMLAICRAVLNKAGIPIPDHLLPLFEGRTE